MSNLKTAYIRHTIEYPDGTVIKGKIDHRTQPELCGIDDVSGMRVLDIATNDGFFAFWSEWHGAEYVMAIDVDSYKGYDWGSHPPPPEVADIFQPDKQSIFWHHHKETGSNIDKRCISIMDLNKDEHGSFDLIWNYGLLYHLRDPLGSLDICRSICHGAMVLETFVHKSKSLAPLTIPITINAPIIPITNFNAPNEGAVVAWLDSAGFEHIFVEIKHKNPTRQRFIACVSEEWVDRMRINPAFKEADEYYFNAMLKAGKRALHGIY